MAGNTTNISIRMDADLKAQADALFAELGMNLSTAFNIFVRQSLREGGIPFEVRRFSRHTFAQNCQHSLMEGDCLMKQIILPVTVHLNIRLPLALLQPEPADAPTGPEPEAHACQGCGNCGGGRKCQHEEKQA